MKMRGLALISVAVGGLSLAAAAVVTPVRQACAQRGRMSFAEDVAPASKVPSRRRFPPP
jgi:hypothetical protein